MKSTIFIIVMLIASSAYAQQSQEAKEDSRARPKKPPVDIAEIIFKRIDSNRNGSISLKEFKASFPRLRQSATRSTQGPTRSTHGRTRGFDGRTPSFSPRGSSRSRGSSRARGSSR